MRNTMISLIFLTLILATACNALVEPTPMDPPSTDIPPTDTSPTDPQPTQSFVKSNLERITSPEVETQQIQSLAQDNIEFALSFYDQILTDEGNIIFSPISLSLALSMTMAGAESSTEEGMRSALQFSLIDEEIHPAFNALLLAIESSMEQTSDDIEGSEFQLNIANSIWGQSNYDFKAEFLDILAQYYGAGMYVVDYQQNPEGARKAINDWVEEETEDKIQDLIPEGAIDTLTRLVLANAIYFNGSWLHPFSESRTEEALFTILDGTEITVEMMKLYGEQFAYTQGENFQAVSLPYLSTDFEMTLLVPDSGAFAGFETALSPEVLADILSQMRSEEVNLEMPKFDFESTINANDPLVALGMSEAFQIENADFSGITELEELYITNVLHKATITVDEEGTEAAAATAVIVGITSAMPGEPISLVIDRPFLFMIRHIPTDSILFMGRVTQP